MNPKQRRSRKGRSRKREKLQTSNGLHRYFSKKNLPFSSSPALHKYTECLFIERKENGKVTRVTIWSVHPVTRKRFFVHTCELPSCSAILPQYVRELMHCAFEAFVRNLTRARFPGFGRVFSSLAFVVESLSTRGKNLTFAWGEGSFLREWDLSWFKND